MEGKKIFEKECFWKPACNRTKERLNLYRYVWHWLVWIISSLNLNSKLLHIWRIFISHIWNRFYLKLTCQILSLKKKKEKEKRKKGGDTHMCKHTCTLSHSLKYKVIIQCKEKLYDLNKKKKILTERINGYLLLQLINDGLLFCNFLTQS